MILHRGNNLVLLSGVHQVFNIQYPSLPYAYIQVYYGFGANSIVLSLFAFSLDSRKEVLVCLLAF